MPYYPLHLWEPGETPFFDPSVEKQQEPSLDPYILPKKEGGRPCVVIFPGGGYIEKADDHEGKKIALWLNSIGYNAFVVDYRVVPYRMPCEVIDGQRAVRYVRFHAEEYGINPNRVGVLGFSAGGHLAACLTVHFGSCDTPYDEIDILSSRPDFSILCYPVITTDDKVHYWSIANILGPKYNNPDLMKYLSCEKQVTSDCPPCFIWATATDGGVPPLMNAVPMATALWEKNVPCELHIFRKGPHGQGLADGAYKPEMYNSSLRLWGDLCREWMYNLFSE